MGPGSALATLACPGRRRSLSPPQVNRPALAGRCRAFATRTSMSLLGLAGVLHVREGLELDIVELAVLLLDLADVDVLDDVARLRVDRDRAARALPLHALHGLDQLVAVGVAARLLERLVDQ